MLTKRTNILFDEEMWRKLSKLAKEEEKSVGQLARTAIEEFYKLKDDRLGRISAACAAIERKRKKFKGKLVYKKLIDYGRKI